MESIATPFIELLQDYIQPGSENYSLLAKNFERYKESRETYRNIIQFSLKILKKSFRDYKCFNQQQIPKSLLTLEYKLNTSKEREIYLLCLTSLKQSSMIIQ
jgi:hypothetical protein